jgi:lysophospholipase L1-like esterase
MVQRNADNTAWAEMYPVTTSENVKVGTGDLTTALTNIGSGSPAGVFTTLSLLQSNAAANTVDGKKRIYVVIADGKWYFWNGTAWTAGGTYQSTGIADKSVTADKISFIQQSSNLFDKSKITASSYLDLSGNVLSDSGFAISDYIPVKASTSYNFKYNAVPGAYYRSDKTFISSFNSVKSITTPADAVYIRLTLYNSWVQTQQVCEGTTLPAYEPYYKRISPDIKLDKSNIVYGADSDPYRRIYNLSDCLNKWKSGEKFPIAFFGDSTTAGQTTSGYTVDNVVGTDYVVTTSYSYLLQQMLREYTGNNTLRIYNAGFSGKATDYAYANIESIFKNNPNYSDVKMIGIMFGINDRFITVDAFKSNVINIINWCYSNGIQPFLVTPQTIVQSYSDLSDIQTSLQLTTVISKTLLDIADKYNLEVIDMNKYTSDFVDNSNLPVSSIIGDTLHFLDPGHKFEAGVLFSILSGRCIFISDNTNINVTNPYIQRTYTREEILSEAETGARYINYSNTASDIMVNDAIIFNDSKQNIGFKVNLSDDANFYVKIDGVTYDIVDSNTVVANLSLGYHRIQLYTGTGSTAQYKGMKFVK